LTSSIRPSGNLLPLAEYSLQVPVVIVNPGGTGRPILLISARLAPLPPSSSRIGAVPSSKSHTRLVVAIQYSPIARHTPRTTSLYLELVESQNNPGRIIPVIGG